MQSIKGLKDSGIELIGRIPEHWRTIRLNFAATINPPISKNSRLSKDLEVSFLPMEKISEDGSLQLDDAKDISEIHGGLTPFEDGDIIVAKITPCFENGKGALCKGLRNGIGFGTTELHVLRPKRSFNGEFLFYWTRSAPFYQMGESMMYGSAGQKRVPIEFIKSFKIAYPSLNEQIEISNFLRCKIRLIDSLTSKRERFIDLLQAKRQAIINQAVTKGLDPNAPTKSSGIEWIGEIPEHWGISRFRRICRVRQGLQIPQTERFWEPAPGRFPYITIRSIHENDPNHQEYIADPPQRVRCDNDDVLLARTGATGEVVTNQCGVFHNNFFLIDFHRNKILKEFLVYYLRDSAVREHLLLQAGVTTVPDLDHDDFYDTPVLLPPKDEQRMIVNYLNDYLDKLNLAASKIEEQIEKIQEYRQTIIAAAVTGKLDISQERSDS